MEKISRIKGKNAKESEIVSVTLDLGGSSSETHVNKALVPVFHLCLHKLDIPIFKGENPYGLLHHVGAILCG